MRVCKSAITEECVAAGDDGPRACKRPRPVRAQVADRAPQHDEAPRFKRTHPPAGSILEFVRRQQSPLDVTAARESDERHQQRAVAMVEERAEGGNEKEGGAMQSGEGGEGREGQRLLQPCQRGLAVKRHSPVPCVEPSSDLQGAAMPHHGCLHAGGTVSAYELQRQENIRRNAELLAQLGLGGVGAAMLPSAAAAPRPAPRSRKRPASPEPAPVRRSLRSRGAAALAASALAEAEAGALAPSSRWGCSALSVTVPICTPEDSADSMDEPERPEDYESVLSYACSRDELPGSAAAAGERGFAPSTPLGC